MPEELVIQLFEKNINKFVVVKLNDGTSMYGTVKRFHHKHFGSSYMLESEGADNRHYEYKDVVDVLSDLKEDWVAVLYGSAASQHPKDIV